jgi:hypothetical protein
MADPLGYEKRQSVNKKFNMHINSFFPPEAAPIAEILVEEGVEEGGNFLHVPASWQEPRAEICVDGFATAAG